MTGPEALLIAVTVLSPGGFWLGYVFIVNDAKWKIARDKGITGEGAASQEELVAVQEQLKQLRTELMALRDRSSDFDMSLETRLHQLERLVRKGESASPEELPSRLGQGQS